MPRFHFVWRAALALTLALTRTPQPAGGQADARDPDDRPTARSVAPTLIPPAYFQAAPADAAQRALRMAAGPRASATAAPVLARTDGVPQNPRLGANFANYTTNGGQTAYSAMRNAGVSRDRITFVMGALEPSSGNYTWSGYDALMNDASANNIEVLGVLIASSSWGDGTFWACDQPVGNAFCMPKLDDWSNFVGAVVNRYKDRSHAWEVWNEPNLPDFFPGTPQQFAQLVRSTYVAIKAADPAATVVLGGIFRGVNIDKIQAIFDALQALPDGAANGYFHDAIGYHLYDGGHCSVFDEVQYLKQYFWFPRVGVKPIWITESGTIVHDNVDANATPAESASFVISNYAYALYHGAGRYYYFRAIDTPDEVNSGETWGLLRRDGAARPSLGAYSVVAQRLPTQFEWSVRRWNDNTTVNRVSFYNTPLGRVSVFWNISNAAQTFTFTAILPSANAYYQDGSTGAIAAVNGQYVLNFGPAQNFRWNDPNGLCKVASLPVILIEPDTTPPTVTLTPLPATSPPKLTLNWTSSDGAQGSGVWWHEIEYRAGNGPWQMLDDGWSGTSIPFNGAGGTTYAFRVRAHDWAGNTPDWTSAPVVSTTTGAWPHAWWLPLLSH